MTQYGIRYEYQIFTEENNAFLYFTEGDQIQDPGKLRYPYKLQNSMKQKCGEYNIAINLYEFLDLPVDKDNFSAVLYVRYSNEKGTFLLIYYPEKNGQEKHQKTHIDRIKSILYIRKTSRFSEKSLISSINILSLEL